MAISPLVWFGIIFTVLAAFCLPIAVIIAYRVKAKRLLPVCIGAFGFILFALVLERILHTVVFTLFPSITSNLLVYGLYGCLAAGVFEETARLVGLTYLRKKKQVDFAAGIGYGIGHGGIEAILLVGLPMLLQLAFLFNPTPEIAAAFNATGITFLFGGLERIFAMAVQMALSVLIWMVVTKRLRIQWYFAAILLHAFVNVPAILFQGGVLSMAVTEAATFAVACCVCAFVYFKYRSVKLQTSDFACDEAALAEKEPPTL